MKGSDWFKECPESLVDAQQHILDVMKSPEYTTPFDHSYMPLPVQYGDHKGVLFVAPRPFAIGEPDDYIQLSVSATTAQIIADSLDAVLPTTRIIDLLHQQATQHQEPHTQPSEPVDRIAKGYSPSMADKFAMSRHSREVANVLAPLYPGLATNCCKHWVVTNRLLTKDMSTAANYGYFSAQAPYVSASGMRMWQTLGTRHSVSHVDYSQGLQLVHYLMQVDGKVRYVSDVLADPELCWLISSEGVLKFQRYEVVGGDGDTDRPPAPQEGEPKRLVLSRVLRLSSPRMEGQDVVQWQQLLIAWGCDLGPYGADGVFGGLTASMTREFQSALMDPQDGFNLVADGVVGPATVRAANQFLAGDPPFIEEFPLVSDFKQAAHYTPVAERQIDLIVIHTAECEERLTSAEALGEWVSGPNAPQASWHYAVDADSIVQSVGDHDVAWHAPGANHNGIGIEHAGYARQTHEEWFDEYSESMLRKSAELVAHLCRKHDIPVCHVLPEGLKAGSRGITTHRDVTDAFHKSTHTDPGVAFPMDWFLDLVRQELGRE